MPTPMTEYLSVKQAAQLLQVSQRSVYGYIQTGKLACYRIGKVLALKKESLQEYQRPVVGRPRTRVPVWRKPVILNPQYLLSMRALLKEGQEEAFKEKLCAIRAQKKHLLPGTVARYVSRNQCHPQQVQFVLIWRQQIMPGDEDRAAALADLRADFADLVDWETISCVEGPVDLNT